MSDPALVAAVREGLAAHADPVRAEEQQRYMKSSLRYHGLPTPLARLVFRQAFAAHPLRDAETWEATALTLWDQASHREEWYAAIALLRHRPYRAWALDPALVGTCRHLVTTGAWWDVVDEIASHLVGDLVRAHPDRMAPLLREWAVDPDPWLRRTAILCQLGSKASTDLDLLVFAIEQNQDRTGFFLRKAIGWALREHARTDPDWVLSFVAGHPGLSTLSRREALKHLDARQG